MRLPYLIALLVTAPALAMEHAGHAAAQQDRASHQAAEVAQAPRVRPGLAIGAAAAPDGTLWMTGLDTAGRLFVRTRGADGAWSASRMLDTSGDVIAADGESRPSLAFGPRGAVVIAYTQPLARPYTGNIRLLRSADGGRTFAPPVTVHDDRQPITHRFASAAFDAHGDLYVVWVDKRDQVREGEGYVGAAIYGKRSSDGGATFGPDFKVADHSCECCRIALAESADTGMVALWRHVFEGQVRDHAFAPLRTLADAAGSPRTASPAAPVRATHDGWVIAACPHHGPGLAAAARGGFHAVWFGLRPDGSSAHYGRLTAAGTPAGPVRALPDPGAEHADVIAAGRRVVIAWRSFDGQATRLRAWTSNDDGDTFTLRELGATTSDNDHPRLVRRGDELLVLWRTTEGLEVFDVLP